MKKVKIYGNEGNSILTDLDENENQKSFVVYVIYGETSKEEIQEHIKNRDFMICQYHTEGYNTAFLYPMSCVINFSHPGTEMVEFTNDWVDGEIKHITYNVANDTWSTK